MEQPFWIPMLAGAMARVWAATLVSPLELIRTKMQSQKLSYAGKYITIVNYLLVFPESYDQQATIRAFF